MMTRRKKALDCSIKLEENLTAADSGVEETLFSSEQTQETFASRTSLPFDAKSWYDVKHKLETIAWIQCDNPNCKKWRKGPREELTAIPEAAKWFCRQNSDPKFNSCDVPEEDVAMYDRLADRSGLKYLKSELCPGALVWAKMAGYCSWPAVVTEEPGTENGLLYRDDDGAISQYHVEFLGRPHSHGWVMAKDVKVFTQHSVHKQLAATEKASHAVWGRGRGRGKKKVLCKSNQMKLRSTYKSGVSVKDGVAEALTLLPVSPLKRLNSCTFVEETKQRTASDGDSKERRRPPASEERRCPDKAVMKGGRKKRPSADPLPGPTTVPDFTSFHSSLHHRTREERLMLDVQMYQRNERAFEHDVTRFMIRNGAKMCMGPFWQNQRVSLFHLFLAVHERGGYTQVTDSRGWAGVYREVTETPCTTDVHNSRSAKLFYHRYLYPYELYIRGKDFKSLFQNNAEDSEKALYRKMANSTVKKQQKQTENHTQEQKNHKTTIVIDDGGLKFIDSKVDLEQDVASDSLKEMLQALEQNDTIGPVAGLEGLPLQNEIDITFYDDSTPTKDDFLPLTAYEPQASPMQTVPNVMNEDTDKQERRCETMTWDLQKLENMEQSQMVAQDIRTDLGVHQVSCMPVSSGSNMIHDKPGNRDSGNEVVLAQAEDPMSDCKESEGGRMETIKDNQQMGSFSSVSASSEQLIGKLNSLQEGFSFIDDHTI